MAVILEGIPKNLTEKQLQRQNQSNSKNIFTLEQTGATQKKVIKSISSNVKEMSDLLKKEKKERDAIIDNTVNSSSSTMKKVERVLQSGKDFHEKALKLKDEAVARSQRSKAKINKL